MAVAESRRQNQQPTRSPWISLQSTHDRIGLKFIPKLVPINFPKVTLKTANIKKEQGGAAAGFWSEQDHKAVALSNYLIWYEYFGMCNKIVIDHIP